jgi:hypothetical protein
MPTVLSAGGNKGSFYADASYRTAAIRKAAIISGQRQKTPPYNPIQKPLVQEQHLASGSTGGVIEAIIGRNCRGFM